MAVNVHNDFDPLLEVIVGSADNYLSHDRDLSFDLFYHDATYRSDWAYPRLVSKGTQRPAPAFQVNLQYVEELQEDVEAFAATLSGLGVDVRRPMALPPESRPIAGLTWQAYPTPALNIRDNTLIIGNEIIETSPAIRSRYLETRLLSRVFMGYFERGAKWTTMPRPILTDASFDLSYVNDPQTTLGGPTERIDSVAETPLDVGVEMMLDGAQCLKIGRDIVVNVATANHRLGVRWLEDHLGSAYRVHTIYRLADNHIDSMVLALKPGVLLVRDLSIRDRLPDELRSWKCLVPPPPGPEDFPKYSDHDLVLTSPYIDINVLSIDQNRVVVNRDCPGVMSVLEKAGFTVIPVRHRHRRLFGGGFHCFTLDTVRKGSLESYM
jgi:glycine amidinotransferase